MGGTEEQSQNERTWKLTETLPITPVLTSPPRFHFQVMKSCASPFTPTEFDNGSAVELQWC